MGKGIEGKREGDESGLTYSGLGPKIHSHSRFHSKGPAFRLLALDRLEQGAEVALAEADRAAAPLDDLEEERRPREDALGEKLEQVALLVVAVHEDLELLQRRLVLLDLADALVELAVVISVRHVEELLAHLAHFLEIGRAHV